MMDKERSDDSLTKLTNWESGKAVSDGRIHTYTPNLYLSNHVAFFSRVFLKIASFLLAEKGSPEFC